MVAQEVSKAFTKTQNGRSFKISLFFPSLQKAVTGEAGSHARDITRATEMSGPASYCCGFLLSFSLSLFLPLFPALALFFFLRRRVVRQLFLALGGGGGVGCAWGDDGALQLP